LTDLKKYIQRSNFMKICSVGGELFDVDIQIDRQTWWS